MNTLMQINAIFAFTVNISQFDNLINFVFLCTFHYTIRLKMKRKCGPIYQ